ncbi:lecithin retinol acyltransferase family protein [Paraburkholderia sp. 35.1]|uniref:lecithin retinol acyltransferase family protein n=1 Tax=Paraburkholderia sp. 35.1 TaxID=2991058 RepID=UPI003D194498
MSNWRYIGLREEPVLGAHLVAPRSGYRHHGIYVGDGNVVHYAGLAGSLHFGPVEEVDIECFAAGQEVWTEPSLLATYEEGEAVERARSRLGENRYNLLTNNCEHFCAWCLYGQSRSEQVHDCLTHPRAAVHLVIGFIRAVFSATRKHLSIGIAIA